jgi:hypothetical protein
VLCLHESVSAFNIVWCIASRFWNFAKMLINVIQGKPPNVQPKIIQRFCNYSLEIFDSRSYGCRHLEIFWYLIVFWVFWRSLLDILIITLDYQIFFSIRRINYNPFAIKTSVLVIHFKAPTPALSMCQAAEVTTIVLLCCAVCSSHH